MTDPTSNGTVETGPAYLIFSQKEQSRLTEDQVIPLYTEEIVISRRKVERAVVQVATVTHTRSTLVDEQLALERVEIERVAINRIVDAAPLVREEGDITIIPVVEEIVVVERRILLKEEVHLRKICVSEQYKETIVLRDQDIVVTRTALDDGHTQQGPSPSIP